MTDSASSRLDGLERRLDGWRARAKQAATRWAFDALPRFSGSALELAAAGFDPAPAPGFFSIDLREIPPELNDDLLELYGRANQVLANRFAFFNTPQAFEDGINWQPLQSPSWCAALHACDYVFYLACTYRISREDVYARQMRYLIADWIASNPPAAGVGWNPGVLAQRLRNWLQAADLARSGWESDAAFRGVLTKSLAQQTAFLLIQCELLTGQEALDASRALLCASRFFRGKRAQEAHDAGMRALSSFLASTGPAPDAVSALAQAQALMEWSLFAPADARAEFLARELRSALDELEALLLPGGALPLVGAQARLAHDELADLAALAAVKINCPAWKSIAGKFGIVPYLYLGESGKQRFEALEKVTWTPQDRVSAEAAILRLVGRDESAMVVSARRPASPEDHADFASYELMLDGYRVLVDAGGFGPEATGYFASPRAHNILLVNNRDPGSDGTAAQAPAEVDFEPFGPGGARVELSDHGLESWEVRHQRGFFRLEDGAWLILDRLEGGEVRTCTSLMHFYPTFEVRAEVDRAVAASRAVSFAVIPIAATNPQLSISRGADAQFPGWFSPEWGVKFPASVLALTWTAVQTPWIGGAVVTRRSREACRCLDVDPRAGRIRFEFAGKSFDLRMKS